MTLEEKQRIEEEAMAYKNKKGHIPTTQLEDEIFELAFKDGAEWAYNNISKQQPVNEQFVDWKKLESFPASQNEKQERDKNNTCSICEKNNVNTSFYKSCSNCGEFYQKYFSDNWIDIDHKLPDFYNKVIFYFKKGGEFSQYALIQEGNLCVNDNQINKIALANNYQYSVDDVSHWMPLPNPPKEK